MFTVRGTCSGARRRVTGGCAWPKALRHVLQVKGEIRVAEFALANEPDEYVFTCTADAASGSADAQVRLGAVPGMLSLQSVHCLYHLQMPFYVKLAWGVLGARGLLVLHYA